MHQEVLIGEIVVTDEQDDLTATGVGSCLVITVYDAGNRIGALAHAMLPRSGGRSQPSRPISENKRDTKYVEEAIDEILEKMQDMGTNRSNLESKLIGGANMFGVYEPDIGMENVVSAREKLKREGIKIVGEAVGGSQGRSVEFSIETGIVTVKMKF
jgi:chemotaxis protein CheD